jgi:hypothetical protein
LKKTSKLFLDQKQSLLDTNRGNAKSFNASAATMLKSVYNDVRLLRNQLVCKQKNLIERTLELKLIPLITQAQTMISSIQRSSTDVEATALYMKLGQLRPKWITDIVAEGFYPLGYATTETGKLMVFPNCHAHRVLEMVNNNPDKTLHRHLVAFFIVDPEKPITSSKDCPPMPRKISHEQALADRLQERKQAKQALNPRQIELCEH